MNNNNNIPKVETIKNINKKNVRFAQNELSDSLESNKVLLPNNEKLSFYSNSWYGNYYLENSNDKELKKLNNDLTNNMQLNPKLNDNNKIESNNLNETNKIKDIYDNSINNFKDYDKKKLINDKYGHREKILDGASNLSYYVPDNWIYEDENINNGGIIVNELTAYDEMALNNTAIY